MSLRSLPFPLLVLVLVLLGGNRHARRGQSRLLVCQMEEDVGVTAGMHHLRSLHRRRSVSTSILVLILFPFPFLLLVVILILVLLVEAAKETTICASFGCSPPCTFLFHPVHCVRDVERLLERGETWRPQISTTADSGEER